VMTLETIRQIRLGEYAVFDLVLAFVGVYWAAPLLSRICRRLGVEVPRQSWLLLTLPLGLLVHLLIGSMTRMTREFINPEGDYLLKVLIVGLVLLGVKGMKRTRRSKR